MPEDKNKQQQSTQQGQRQNFSENIRDLEIRTNSIHENGKQASAGPDTEQSIKKRDN